MDILIYDINFSDTLILYLCSSAQELVEQLKLMETIFKEYLFSIINFLYFHLSFYLKKKFICIQLFVGIYIQIYIPTTKKFIYSGGIIQEHTNYFETLNSTFNLSATDDYLTITLFTSMG
jgi:hypothetical protein